MALGARRVWLLGVVGLCATACLAPTLPLPPPDPVVEPPDEFGNARVSGNTEPNGLITALNERTGLTYGTRTGVTGFYEFFVQAQTGDELTVWVEVGGRQSDLATVLVP